MNFAVIDGVVYVVNHVNPHGDELCADVFKMRFDPKYRHARIITFGSNEEAIKFAAKNSNAVLIGFGGGAFDEHGRDGDDCAATLVARDLKLYDDLRFFRLLEEVRTCDLTAKALRTQVPEVLKVLYDHHPEAEVIGWGLKAYDVLVTACEEGNYKPKATGILEEISVELTEKFINKGSSKAMRLAWLDCQTAVNNGRGALTELRTVTELIALSDGPDIAKKWATMGIEALFQRQLDFEKAVEEVNKGYRFSAQWSRQQGSVTLSGKFFGVAIYSDNSQTVRAFRSDRGGRMDLLIVRNKSGHVQVFSNAKSNVPMELCAKALRLAEAKKRGIHGSIKELLVEGDCEKVPQWHFFKKGGMVMNGSRSHPGVEVTRLSDNEILEAVTNAWKGAERTLSNSVLR